MPGIKENGGRMTRIGSKFHKELEEIQYEKLKNGTGLDEKTKKIVSLEKLSNMVVRNVKYWKYIKEEIIKASQEEVNEYGK